MMSTRRRSTSRRRTRRGPLYDGLGTHRSFLPPALATMFGFAGLSPTSPQARHGVNSSAVAASNYSHGQSESKRALATAARTEPPPLNRALKPLKTLAHRFSAISRRQHVIIGTCEHSRANKEAVFSCLQLVGHR